LNDVDETKSITSAVDFLTPVIQIFPIATVLLGFVPPRIHFRLLNTSKKIRTELLEVHFARFRQLAVLKDVDYYQRLAPPEEDDNSENDNEWSADEEELPDVDDEELWHAIHPQDMFFTRFNNFSFEEFVVGKIMQLPPYIHPTADQGMLKMINFTRVLTKLTLDGTKVTSIGLFGAFRMMRNGMARRETPGLISYFSGSLRELSVQHCPHVEHCDIAIYLLSPPTQDVAMRNLRILKVFNAGEVCIFCTFSLRVLTKYSHLQLDLSTTNAVLALEGRLRKMRITSTV